ncbi:hypothetical protein [Fodinicurvata sediminis]|uniref:hypothetical protein n=1 Tax=Fodinicurvata sediminis TaxID=1121832 RepID=UPI0003B546CB|nr:hypothetical protein [Fodinicurvata sediminis]
MKYIPRGIRCNNPGNIRIGDPWEGLLEAPADFRRSYGLVPAVKRHLEEKYDLMDIAPEDSEFCVFMAPEYGIRAIARILITYQDRRKANDGSDIDTVREIIERWAPASENNVDAYASHVRERMGLDEGEKIPDVKHYAVMRPLVKSIIAHENGPPPKGADWYRDRIIDKGLMLAGIDVPQRSLDRKDADKAIKTAAASGTAAGGIEAIGKSVDAVAPAFPLLNTLAQYAPLALLGVAAGSVALWLYLRNR